MFVCSVLYYHFSKLMIIKVHSKRIKAVEFYFYHLFCSFGVERCYFCIRQHDVNILMSSFQRRANDVCVLRFFFTIYNYSNFIIVILRVENSKLFLATASCKSLFSIIMFCSCMYNCIRQHDVNILTQSFQRRGEMFVCSVFFLLLSLKITF